MDQEMFLTRCFLANFHILYIQMVSLRRGYQGALSDFLSPKAVSRTLSKDMTSPWSDARGVMVNKVTIPGKLLPHSSYFLTRPSLLYTLWNGMVLSIVNIDAYL